MGNIKKALGLLGALLILFGVKAHATTIPSIRKETARPPADDGSWLQMRNALAQAKTRGGSTVQKEMPQQGLAGDAQDKSADKSRNPPFKFAKEASTSDNTEGTIKLAEVEGTVKLVDPVKQVETAQKAATVPGNP